MTKIILAVLSLLMFSPLAVSAIQTQINKVTDLFDKHIENKDELLQSMKEQNENTSERIKSRSGHEYIEGMGEAEGKARELNAIKESDLDNAGRQKRVSKEYRFYDENELEPDYTKPGNRMHKLDVEEIVEATERTMNKLGIALIDKLLSIGFDCKTVKGAIHKEPTYYIEIQREERRNTEYDQFFCEEPRNQYNCSDSVSLNCVKRGKRFGEWQYRVIRLSGHFLKHSKEAWGYGKKRYRKYWDWFITPYHPKSFGGGIFSDPDLTVDSPWCNNPQAIINDARLYLADLLNIALEQIREDIVFPPSGVGIGPQYNGYGRWQQVWKEYEFGYYYRDAREICEQWSEDWTERCALK